jgi:hypothetical protein
MFGFVRKHLPLLAFCCVASALMALAACNGSSSTTPGPMATSTPASVTQALPAAGHPLAFPNHKGFSGQLIVPPNNAPAGTNVTVSVFTTPLPAGPGTSDVSHHPLSIFRQPMALPSGTTAIWEGTMGFDTAVALSASPTVTITVPSQYSTTTNFFTLELWITTGNPQFTWSNPSVSGQTLTFSGGTGLVGVNGPMYYLYLYVSPNASPSPSPSPSIAPSPSPSPSIAPSPSPSPSSSAAPCNPANPTAHCAITFNTVAIIFPNVPPAQWGCGGNPYLQNFTAIEASYAGNFTAVSNNTQLATVSQSAPNAFSVTDVWQYPGGQNGSSFGIIVSDTQGNSSVLDGDFNGICLP